MQQNENIVNDRIMDYEKEYKRKALEPIVNYIESVMASYSKEELEARIKKALPEKESEDERLRKLLVWQVHRNIEDETNDLAQSVYDGIKGHDPDLEESIEDWKKCLAYLEKQKDKVVKIDHDREQQPAEWSEEDEKKLKTVISLMRTSRSVDPFYDKMCLEGWLKALPERFNLHPRMEWSEEDEKELDDIISILDNLGFEEFYKSSRDQDAEEDRLYYKEIQCLKRLKSLCPQPQWKPSEEQISALEKAIVKMHTPNDIGILAELRDNLKNYFSL